MKLIFLFENHGSTAVCDYLFRPDNVDYLFKQSRTIFCLEMENYHSLDARLDWRTPLAAKFSLPHYKEICNKTLESLKNAAPSDRIYWYNMLKIMQTTEKNQRPVYSIDQAIKKSMFSNEDILKGPITTRYRDQHMRDKILALYEYYSNAKLADNMVIILGEAHYPLIYMLLAENKSLEIYAISLYGSMVGRSEQELQKIIFPDEHEHKLFLATVNYFCTLLPIPYSTTPFPPSANVDEAIHPSLNQLIRHPMPIIFTEIYQAFQLSINKFFQSLQADFQKIQRINANLTETNVLANLHANAGNDPIFSKDIPPPSPGYSKIGSNLPIYNPRTSTYKINWYKTLSIAVPLIAAGTALLARYYLK